MATENKTPHYFSVKTDDNNAGFYFAFLCFLLYNFRVELEKYFCIYGAR